MNSEDLNDAVARHLAQGGGITQLNWAGQPCGVITRKSPDAPVLAPKAESPKIKALAAVDPVPAPAPKSTAPLCVLTELRRIRAAALGWSAALDVSFPR